MTTDIYLDGNATSAILPAALAAAVDAMAERYGNPSSSHGGGLRAKAVLDGVHRRAARVLGVGAGRLMFNSGATEGIQTAVLSALCALRERQARGEATGTLLLYGATEHKAVPESLAHWSRLLGLHLQLRAIPVDHDGRHDLAMLRGCAGQAALVCTMAANNETGAISDLAGIEAALRASGSAAYWLVDGVQALGKLDLNLAASRIDYAAFSGHKLYAPKGIGMLYVRADAPFTALIVGGGQQGALRSGTENMAGIAALGAVLEALERGGVFRGYAELNAARARLADSLRAALPGVVFNQTFATSLPTTLNFSVPGLSSRELMDVFDAARVRVSSGSACSAAKATPSYVLDAMGLAPWRSGGAIRMSFGPLIDDATIDEACLRIARCGAALRASCLIPSNRAPQQHDGVVQLGVDGACSWLLLDAASRSCIVIDPLPALTERIEAYVRCQNYRVSAILGSSPGSDRTTLVQALGRHIARDISGDADCDAFGWPAAGAGVTLADGGLVAGIEFGARVLARVRHDDARASYLLGAATGARLGDGADGAARLVAADVRFAFTGHAAQSGLAGVIGLDTLLCPARDPHNQFCTSLRAAPPADLAAAELELDADALDAFFLQHPGAQLIDVREPYEYAAAAAVGPGGRPARSVPLSRLTDQLDGWLRGERLPLVFFCRSGNRSIKAVQCLRRLGHGAAWHVAGGVALAPPARAA
ncbi:aminotransferase class V-fold PLP-dependent enzyme [Rugamonas sp.]|uniref:aminotransferase class V-fold PLP-dependent enzyme n=1 Tax=Rugamonas sp. TaxID=1926287 RepID=UPI0025E27E61|nr:aminotransferase class V-fold PLP-dependent enzyme [Rugamonas sp.]